MPENKISIAGMACTEVGIPPIVLFDDDTAEGTVIRSHYENIVANIFSLHYWRFSCAQVVLTLLAGSPAGRWDYAFQIPSTCLLVRAVTMNDVTIPFEIYDDMIYCDADGTIDVVLDGVFRVDESKWPAYFVRMVVLSLAAVLASGVREDSSMRDKLDANGLTQFRLSKNRDSGSRTTSKIKTTRITNSRLRRGGIGQQNT